MKRMARVHATVSSKGAIFEYDIADPHTNGWLFLHKITERPTVAGPDGKLPPMKTELVAGFSPATASFVEFYVEGVTNVVA